MDYISFIPLSVEEHVDYFHFLVEEWCCYEHSCNKVLCGCVLISFECMPRSGIPRSYGNSVLNP
jgi:hypothetical protein